MWRGSDECKPTPPQDHRRKVLQVRYLVILEALGHSWGSAMRAKGVSETTIDSWQVYWDQLTMKAGTCKITELRQVGHQMAACFRTAMWYMEKDEKPE